MKFVVPIIFVILVIGVLIVSLVTSEPRKHESQELEKVFYEGFELGDRFSEGWTRFEVRDPTEEELRTCDAYPQGKVEEYILCSTSLDLVTDPVKTGNYALKVTVHPGDASAPGDEERAKDRAEVVRKEFGNEGRYGEEQIYSWDFLIPSDYAYNIETDTIQIMGQLHFYEKEEDASPPPVSVEYGTRNGQSGVYMQYGLKGQNRGIIGGSDIELGKWIHMQVHIHWSTGDDGFIEAYKDGSPLTPFNGKDHRVYGPNMPRKDAITFFKIGIYREHNVTTTNSVYFDNIEILST